MHSLSGPPNLYRWFCRERSNEYDRRPQVLHPICITTSRLPLTYIDRPSLSGHSVLPMLDMIEILVREYDHTSVPCSTISVFFPSKVLIRTNHQATNYVNDFPRLESHAHLCILTKLTYQYKVLVTDLVRKTPLRHTQDAFAYGGLIYEVQHLIGL